MRVKSLSVLAGAALLASASIAGAAEPLSNAELDQVSAGTIVFRNVATAVATADAIGFNTYTAAGAQTAVILGLGSSSGAISYSRASLN